MQFVQQQLQSSGSVGLLQAGRICVQDNAKKVRTRSVYIHPELDPHMCKSQRSELTGSS